MPTSVLNVAAILLRPLSTLNGHLVKIPFPIVATSFSAPRCHISSQSKPRTLAFSTPRSQKYNGSTATTGTEEPTYLELLGSNNWKNLLNPLDVDLRKLILRCGDLTQATYDAFNDDQNSRYCGCSHYGKKNFFQKVMLESPEDYQVKSFLYATASVSIPEGILFHSMSRDSWDSESNWIGYIAVTSDAYTKAIGRRVIHIAWRGTIRDYEWIDILGPELVSVKELLNSSQNYRNKEDDEEKVMLGWLTLYTSDSKTSPFTKVSARVQLTNAIKQLKKQYQGDELSIILSGHSLGASLSVLSGFDIVENAVSDDVPVTAFIFGCPMVGNKAFNERLQSHKNLNILHVKNTIDLIPHYPGVIFGYEYTGTELVIDTRKSTFLKDSKDPSDWHNLQAMLNVVAGWNGKDEQFEFKVKRSVALVNKSCEFLKDEYLVPGSWWVAKNKGMVRDKEGEWALAPEGDEDFPVPEY